MAVKITGSYKGAKRVLVTHESGATFETVAPKDNGGDGSSFSPTDLLATALGSCVLTTMAIIGERKGITLENATFEVLKHMTSTPPRKLAQLDVVIGIPAELYSNQEKLATLKEIAHSCPVHLSLKEDIIINTTFVIATLKS